MEDRVRPAGRGGLAVTTLGLLLLISAAWWALALWPAAMEPGWLSRTREVCFGTQPSGLPSAGGWVLLIGEPIGMIGVLVVAWGGDLRVGLRNLLARGWGRALVSGVLLAVASGVVAAAVRVRTATVHPEEPIAGLARVDRPVPPFELVDQTGHRRTIEDFTGRIVLVTFAYAHCTAICPAQVHGVLAARRGIAGRNAVAVVITVDPWRDPPSRLPAIAEGWEARPGEFILSGTPEQVTEVLKAWRIPTERSIETGEVAHPATVYIIGPSGRIVAIGVGAGRQFADAVGKLAATL